MPNIFWAWAKMDTYSTRSGAPGNSGGGGVALGVGERGECPFDERVQKFALQPLEDRPQLHHLLLVALRHLSRRLLGAVAGAHHQPQVGLKIGADAALVLSNFGLQHLQRYRRHLHGGLEVLPSGGHVGQRDVAGEEGQGFVQQRTGPRMGGSTILAATWPALQLKACSALTSPSASMPGLLP